MIQEANTEIKQGKGNHLPLHVKQDMLLRFDEYRRKGHGMMTCCAMISSDMEEIYSLHLNAKVVWAALNRLRPTTDIAKMMLKAKAAKLMQRVIKKATVTEAIDLLSRPGVDVIGRVAKDEGGSQGFFLSVQADTCGAVKVGIATSAPAQKQLADTVDFDPFAGAVGGFDGVPEDAQPESAPKSIGGGESASAALQRARSKIAASRRALAAQGDSGDHGIQGADEHAEP